MEIERKFLVDATRWEALEKPVPKRIIQAYIVNTLEKTVRVRIKDNNGYLTIKGATHGYSRIEFEYAIPLEDAESMIEQFAEKTIKKLRYEIMVGRHLWEVDVFSGKLEGLVLAEVELSHENELFEEPEWITEEVSTDPNYFNAKLIEKC